MADNTSHPEMMLAGDSVDTPPSSSSLNATKAGVDTAPVAEGVDPTTTLPVAASATPSATTAATTAAPPPELFVPAQPKRQNSSLPGAGEAVPARASANCTLASAYTPGPNNAPDPYAGKTIYSFQLLDCYHELYDLDQHKGQVVLISVVASKCKDYSESGYKTLVTLFNRYHNRDFTVIAVPCNQFGGCEPGNEDEIAENVPMLYNGVGDINFPIMAKVDVNGDHELPLFAFLKARVRGTLGQSAIKWNFTSFLVDREGNPILRFAPGATIEEIEPRVLEALAGNPPGSSTQPAEAKPTATAATQ